MLLKSKHVLAVVAMTLVGFTTACTEDEPQAVEPVAATPAPEAAPTPEATPPPVAFTPEAVYFAFDDYTLDTSAQGKLQGLADHMKATQGAVVQVEGHCDERGSIEYNLALGERRAQSVKNYLTQLGVEGSRLSTISYGEEKPAVEGHDEAAWEKNRRAEFTISQQ
jgi:peptidoglycan-associated lipoprotein